MRGQVITDKHYDRQSSLLDWCSSGYGGLSGISSVSDLPKEMLEFCAGQYERFAIAMPPIEVIEKGMWATFAYVDYMDPYSLFFGITDVEATDDWAAYTYDVRDMNGKVDEADPELLETFSLVPGRDAYIFDKVYQEPGFQNKEISHLADGIEEVINGTSVCDEDMYSEASPGTKAWLDAHSPAFVEVRQIVLEEIECIREYYDGENDKGEDVYREEIYTRKPSAHDYKLFKAGKGRPSWNNFFGRPEVAAYYEGLIANERALETRLDYYRLAAWASLAWMISPMARQWRDTTYDIFHLCYKHGEAVLYSGYFLKHDSYKKVERHPESCVVCGLRSWCVELTFLEGVNRFLCEHHLNGDLPKLGQLMCGTKVCKYTDCAFHPLHGVENGRGLAYRQSGQLRTMVMANNNPMLTSSIKTSQKLLC